MARIYGTPSVKASAVIKNRDDFNAALRSNNQKSLLGLMNSGDDDDAVTRVLGGMLDVQPGVRTHKFAGYTSYLEAGTKLVWASARAVDITANVIISTDMELVPRDQNDKKKKRVIKPDPDLVKLLANPNPYDTISEMLYLWVCHMKFTGNAFWLKDEMNMLGQPKAIYALNPRMMTIVPDKGEKVAYYIYTVNGHEVRFETDEIIHFKRPHANNAVWGLGEIEQGESLYEEFINQSLYRTRFMANGAMPSGVLVKDDDQVDQVQWDELKLKFEEKYGGAKNAGKTAWLNGKWSLLQMGITAQHMQEMEKAKVNVEHIFLNHAVPLSVAGFGSANYATAKQEEINHRKHACLPLVNIFTDKINSEQGLVMAFNPTLMLDFALTGLIDVEQVGKDYAWLMDRAGLTPNQARELAGLPRIENPMLDQYFMLATLVPVEMAGLAAAPNDPNTLPGKPALQNAA